MKSYHIWTLDNWTRHIDPEDEHIRRGLRLRFDRGVDPEVRRACMEYARFLRREYDFPLRVVIYFKKTPKIRAQDGEMVSGTFMSMAEYTMEPYARIATGDYPDLCRRWGKDSALTAILLSMGHELTHYFQWINDLPLTRMGEERQATRYARYVLDEYAETREHP